MLKLPVELPLELAATIQHLDDVTSNQKIISEATSAVVSAVRAVPVQLNMPAELESNTITEKHSSASIKISRFSADSSCFSATSTSDKRVSQSTTTSFPTRTLSQRFNRRYELARATLPLPPPEPVSEEEHQESEQTDLTIVSADVDGAATSISDTSSDKASAPECERSDSAEPLGLAIDVHRLSTLKEIQERYQCQRCTSIDTGYDILVENSQGFSTSVHVHDRMTLAEIKRRVEEVTNISGLQQQIHIVEEKKRTMSPLSVCRPSSTNSDTKEVLTDFKISTLRKRAEDPPHFSSPLHHAKSFDCFAKRDSNTTYSPIPSIKTATTASPTASFSASPEASFTFGTTTPTIITAPTLSTSPATSPTPSTPCHPPRSKKRSTILRLQVRTTPGRFVNMEIDHGTDVGDLKKAVLEKEGIDRTGTQRLVFQGKELNDWHNLAFVRLLCRICLEEDANLSWLTVQNHKLFNSSARDGCCRLAPVQQVQV